MLFFSSFLSFFLVFWFFLFFSVIRFFGLFRNSLFRLFRFYTETESFDISIIREYIWEFFKKFRVVSVCFGLLRNRSDCFGCFDIGSKQQTKPKVFFLVSQNKPKQTRNRSCFGLFQFEPKLIFVCFEDTLFKSDVTIRSVATVCAENLLSSIFWHDLSVCVCLPAACLPIVCC